MPVVLSLAAVLLVGWFSLGISDPDLWWHLKTGQYVLEKHSLPAPDPFAYTTYMGKPAYSGEETTRYFNLTHEWLAQVILYAIYAAGKFPGLIVFREAALCAICGIVGWLSYRRTRRFYLSMAAALATASTQAVLSVDRPQIFTFLLVAVTIAIMEYRRPLWLLPPIMIFWANCHGGFFLGWVVMGAYGADALVSRWRGKPLADERRLWIVCGVSVLASGLNPNGFNALGILQLYRQSPMQMSIIEWHPPKYWAVSAFTIVLYGAAAALIWARTKARISDWVLFGLFAAAALMANRNTMLVAIAGPIVLASYFPWKRALPAAVDIVVPLLLLAGVGAEIARGKFRFPSEAWRFPSGAADFLLAHRVTAPMFNVYGMGGYLMWRLWPQEKVFVDGRALNESVFADYQRIAFSPEAASGPLGETLLRKYGIDVIVTPLVDFGGRLYLLPISMVNPAQTEWKLVYQDAQGVVLMRRPPAAVQPLNSLDILTSMESQCSLIMEHISYPLCAQSLAQFFGSLGDQARADRWTAIYQERLSR